MGKSTKHELESIAVISGASCFLVAYHMIVNRSLEFWYLPWNLLLALIPLGLSVFLVTRSLHRWSTVLSLLVWLAFLPNAFYIITDIIHITDRTRFSQLYDIIVLTMTIAAGYWAGLMSLRLIDKRYLVRYGQTRRRSGIALIAMLSGIAIYIGRELRWNSWDLIAHPTGIAQDLIDLITMPRLFAAACLGALATTALIWISYLLYRRSFSPN